MLCKETTKTDRFIQNPEQRVSVHRYTLNINKNIFLQKDRLQFYTLDSFQKILQIDLCREIFKKWKNSSLKY